MITDFKLLDAGATPYAFAYFNDFIRPDDFVTAGGVTGTAITSGTLAANAANGGNARLSGAATTDASGYQVQTAAAHVVTLGKPMSYKARVQVNESTSTDVAVESQWELGLFVIDTSIDASNPTDGFYFAKADGATAITINARAASGTATTVTLASPYVEDKAVHTYGISVVPLTSTTCNAIFSIDGVAVGTLGAITSPLAAIVLAGSAAFRSGNNLGTKWMDVDYIGTAQVR